MILIATEKATMIYNNIKWKKGNIKMSAIINNKHGSDATAREKLTIISITIVIITPILKYI